jgi:signal transduction histidine kinase
MASLGDLLISRRGAILERWVERIRWEHAPEALSRGELWDHLPHILDELLIALRIHEGHRPDASPLPTDSPASAQHGSQRLRVGFDVEEVVREYGSLADILLDEAQAAGATLPVAEWRLALQSINTGIAEAISAYTRRRDEELRRQTGHHVAFVAHELRGPIMTARTAAAALSLAPSDKRLYATLDRSLRLLSELVDQVVTVERLASDVELERKPVELTVLLQEVIEESQAAGESRDVKVVLEAEPALPFSGDRRLLRSALGNLVINAVKFTRIGGTVRVRGGRGDGFVSLQVQDQCGGLPPGDPTELFKPFIQRGADRSGLGLGLAIVHQAVVAHGGQIRVENVPGDGCTFTVILPYSS